ncbi:MAG: pteridine-dependent deoxygenase [Thermoanaerobaculia bacterium]
MTRAALLRVAASASLRGASLQTFALRRPSPGRPGLGLPFLGGSLESEHWLAEGPVSRGRYGEVAWRRAEGVVFLAFEGDDSHDLAALTETGYRQILETAARHGCPHLLRAWNYMPRINEGCGDDERYRRFCEGRSRAMEAAGIAEETLCAGTAIGGEDPALRIYALAGAEAGIPIENPRQLSAYRYPRRYGPRSPSFARATALPQPDGEVLLLVSGTASIVGHRTAHPGRLDAQLHELTLNLSTLVGHAARRLGRPAVESFDEEMLLRAYVRHAADWPRVRDHLAGTWPGARIAGLRGDVCRRELLVEIEAVVRI